MDLSLGMLTLGASQIVVGALTVLFLFCSVLLILTVLIQRPQGGGLSGAFGGGGGAGGETAFGARTGDALTMATIGFFVLWLAIAVGLVLYMSPVTAPTGTGAAATSTEVATPEDNPGGAAGETGAQGAAEVLDADGNPVSGETGENGADGGAAGETTDGTSDAAGGATDGAVDGGADGAADGQTGGAGDGSGAGTDESTDGGGR
ncbi:MAG: preprotein translocase subunit SecG [Phycisphaerales bacterium JB054]